MSLKEIAPKYLFFFVLLLLFTSNTTAFYTSAHLSPYNIRRSATITMTKAKQSSSSSSGKKSASRTATKMKSNNVRWAIRGIGGELFHNMFLRQIRRARKLLGTSKQQRLEEAKKVRLPVKNEVALITGATGGIGSSMAEELAFRGYDVIIAARNAELGKELVLDIQRKLENSISTNKEHERAKQQTPNISFIEYHADIHQSALDVASKLTVLNKSKPLTVLINNAGIMGKSEQLSMRVNLLGPVTLTLALLPLMMTNCNSDERKNNGIKIINVSSSAHLRATGVFDQEDLRSESKSLMNIFPDSPDEDLSTYAKSKLALLQFSTLLRHKLPKNKGIQVFDAHPGLVWTPLLRNHIGSKATNTLQKTGLAGLIYKSPLEGSQALLAALDHPAGTSEEQLYFVNGQPGGYASPESRDLQQSQQLLDRLIAPELEGVVQLPDGW